MDCGQCGEANREGARFCGECGASLARRCSSCNAELLSALKFCDECGTPTSATSPPFPPEAAAPTPPSDATRKTVTALFADLVGSTSFGERADAEVARTVMARYHALLQEAVDARGGTVAKFMGDGMMATFGIPEIAEDDALRAVHAGIDIQRRFTDFAATVAEQHDETLGLRVGVNTGEVVIASGDADLVGDALNVAARIEHACRPGHVTVGEDTWRLTRGEFGYEALGEVTVAGRAQPVAIYEVAGGASVVAEASAPFVGRTPEMARLRAVLGAAISARAARLVTVLGSPGVGKTRLSRELCAATEADDGAVTFEIRCDRAGDATFAPIAQLIRDATDLGDDTDAASARERLGALLADDDPDRDRLVDILGALVGAAPTRSVEETFWAVRRLVSATAADRPMVVVIDDIQWAEPLLLDLLEHLAEWVRDVPLLLLCLARPELREVRPSLAERNRRVEDVLALDGLDSAATEALAAGLLGTDRLPAGLVERLPASTDGNPLFVRELVRMLVDDEVIRRNGDEWELAIDADAVEVPPTIQSLLATRVERLRRDERTVLELASVIGAEFNLGALRELAGADTPLPKLLESMRRKELVEPTGTYWGDEPVHRFHHVLIRDAAYRRLLKTTRAELHEKVAVWTDAAASGLIGEHEAVIAFHYEQAHRYRSELGTVDDHVIGLGRRAAELLSAAADRALGQDDLAAAGTLARRALALLPESDTTARAELLTAACECTLSSGDVAGARPVVEQLRAEAGDDPTLGAWASCFEAQLVGLTDPDGLVGAEATATGAARVMEELGDGAGEAKAHQVRAGLLARLGRVGDAELELDLALGAARRVDDRRRVTAVLGAAPLAALWGPSPVARAGGRCLDVVRLLRITTASPSVEATSMRCQAVLEALRGRFDVARSMLDSSRATLEELGLRHGLLETAYLTGVVELVAGDPASAITPLREAYDGLIEMGVGIDAGRAAALLAHALVAEGRVDDAEPMAAASEELAGQDLKTAIAWRVARAEVLAARGDVVGGITLAQEAVEIAAATDLVIDHADACVALAALHDVAGDTAAARSVRAEAKRLYDLKGATVPSERLRETAAHTVEAPAIGSREESRAIEKPTSAPPEPDNTAVLTPLAENEAVAVLAKAWELTVTGRVDEIGLLCAEDAVVFDRQRIVGEDLVGRDAIVANCRAVAALGAEAARVVPLAVRGSRLALARTTVSFGSFENAFVSVVELDSRGLGRHIVTFDEDQLGDALDELDARYLAGPGPHGEETHAAIRALNTQDWDAFRDSMEPDCTYVDHRELGFPTLDREGVVEMFRGYRELAPEIVTVQRKTHGRGAARLLTVDVSAATSDGNVLEWCAHVVNGLDPAGRVIRQELFDEGDFPAALARFDELGAAEPADARHPRAENAATQLMTRFREVFARNDIDALEDFFAESYERYDCRTVVSGADIHGRAEIRASVLAFFDVGMRFAAGTELAVRGERLCLGRGAFVSKDDHEISFLVVSEIDADLRIRHQTFFDPDAFDDAIDELDQRFLAGEGAAHRRLLETARASVAANRAEDYEAVSALLAPDFTVVDHRPIGFGAGDRDLYLATRAANQGVVIGEAPLYRTIHIVGNALLAVVESTFVDDHGNPYSRAGSILIRVDTDARIDRMEWFGDDDFPAALARLDELGASPPADPRPPRVENATTRAVDRFFELAIAGRFDEAAERLHPDVIRVDHRTAVSDSTTHGRDEYLAALRGAFDVGFSGVTADHLAVRGERLNLMRTSFVTDGDMHLVILSVCETDPDGLVSHISLYDDDALDDAMNALYDRFVAGDGAPHAPENTVTRLTATTTDGLISERLEVTEADEQSRFARTEIFDGDALADATATLDRWHREAHAPQLTNAATRVLQGYERAFPARDWSWFRAALADDVVNDDRRPTVSSGRSVGREELMALTEALASVGFTALTHELTAIRGERLVLFRRVFHKADGFDLEVLAVMELDDAGRVAHNVLFDPDDLPAALIELDRRYAAGEGAAHAGVIAVMSDRSAPPPPQNTLTIGLLDLIARRTSGDSIDAEHIADDIVVIDRRAGVSAGTLTGREPFAANARSHFDVFDGVVPTVLAVRGERLALIRMSFTADDFVSVRLTVFEINEDAQLAALVIFDEDDFELALDELEDRYIAGEGAEHEYVTRWIRDAGRAMRRPGPDAVRSLMAPDFVLVDHRTLGYGSVDLADLTTLQAARDEQVTDDRKLHRTREIRGDVILAWYETHASAPDGGEYTWSHWVIWQLAAGQWIRLEMFDLDDEAAARARFAELAAETRTPHIDNAVVRRIVRGLWLQKYEPQADPTADLADDLVLDDRRSGVTLPQLHGADQLVEASHAQNELFGPTAIEPVAVRGDRLALVHTRAVAPSGFEVGGYMTFEADDDGRFCHMVCFDEDDLVAALDALEQRYADLAGDLRAPAESVVITGIQALNHRAWDVFESIHHPAMIALDHTPLGFAPTDRDGFLNEQMRGLAALVENFVVVPAKLMTSGRAVLVVGHGKGTTIEGSEYEWHWVCAGRVVDSLVTHQEFFDDADWSAALARFEEFASEPATLATEPENRLTRQLRESIAQVERGDPAYAGVLADDVVILDRRSGVSAGTITGRAEFTANARAHFDVFVHASPTVLAVRGDRLALVRMEYQADGFVSVRLNLFETNEDGQLAVLMVLDEGALADALEELETRHSAIEARSTSNP